jgi:antitoxin HicB
MRYSYPCTLEDDEAGAFVATFADVPEAITGGKDRSEALAMASDALATALAGYVHLARVIPEPSPAAGRPLVAVAPVVAAKLALYQAMKAQKISKSELARRLGVSEAAVRRVCNPDHRSHIGQVEKALKLLGRTLVVEDKAA